MLAGGVLAGTIGLVIVAIGPVYAAVLLTGLGVLLQRYRWVER